MFSHVFTHHYAPTAGHLAFACLVFTTVEVQIEVSPEKKMDVFIASFIRGEFHLKMTTMFFKGEQVLC